MTKRSFIVGTCIVTGLLIVVSQFVFADQIDIANGGSGSITVARGGSGTIALDYPPTTASANVAWQAESNHISSGTLTSSTMSVTIAADTKLVECFEAFRRNSSQTYQTPDLGGTLMTLSTSSISGQFRLNSWYLFNPTPGNFNFHQTLSASTPGYGAVCETYSGVGQVPSDESRNSTELVTSATNTITIPAVNNFHLAAWVWQDPSLVGPSLTTSDGVIRSSFTFSSSGNGGYLIVADRQDTDAGTSSLNMTASSSRRHMDVGNTVRQ